MAKSQSNNPPAESSAVVIASARRQYEGAMQAMRAGFERDLQSETAGASAIAARSAAVDTLIQTLGAEVRTMPGVALLAVGGYGRRQLFPYSDIDLMFLLDAKIPEKTIKEVIRSLNQALWDCGLRVSPMTRTLAECERFDPENVEFTLSLFDARLVVGDAELVAKLIEKCLPKLLSREQRKITNRLLEATRTRHARYGDTLFHLEPNLKECPGGLRDSNVCAWLARLEPATPAPATPAPAAEFSEACAFLQTVRVFLHLRHRRDDNVLDWQAQDDAAAAPLALTRKGLDAAYWMRLYFRHARTIDRRTSQVLEQSTPVAAASPLARLRKAPAEPAAHGFEVRQGRIRLGPAEARSDPARDSEIVLALFAACARSGARLALDTELRLEAALPHLSAQFEDGPGLWRALSAILTGPYAGTALRSMHALGFLELLLPEFHGIDALVIRDAYHRYTVDEHTFVLIDTLHALATRKPSVPATGLDPSAARFAGLLRDLPHPSLLFLAALLHDTGKGHAALGHAAESARMAQSVVERLELDPYEAGLVLSLIRHHLEMSAALRRDVFDAETIRAFAAYVPTPEALRMLTLFTYADIAAVHPDALTPWKAENLWRLHLATADFLDRHIDDERVAATAQEELSEIIHRLYALLAGQQLAVDQFLAGFPRRYLLTRTPEEVRDHFLLSRKFHTDSLNNQLAFKYASINELTLVTQDRPMLFATLAGALAGWGMNIVTADAFSNAAGLVVDSFRFTDTYRTLELNLTERSRFEASLHDVLAGAVSIESLLASRRRARPRAPKVQVETRLEFDDQASMQSTLLQVVAQDTPGLLRALALPIAQSGCSIEVALIDTEGEMAIDVFYLTCDRAKLGAGQQAELKRMLLSAVEQNAS